MAQLLQMGAKKPLYTILNSSVQEAAGLYLIKECINHDIFSRRSQRAYAATCPLLKCDGQRDPRGAIERVASIATGRALVLKHESDAKIVSLYLITDCPECSAGLY